jgi:hypothetical protein
MVTVVERLMRRLGEAGLTAIVKIDHERLAEEGKPWTVVFSGPVLGDEGFVRAEEECLNVGLLRLRERGMEWRWVSAFIPE